MESSRQSVKAPDAKVLKLISDMIETFGRLGSDPMARIDARIWYDHYRRKAKRLRILTDDHRP